MNQHYWKKNFYTMWSGQAISILTSSILQMTLIWHLAATTQSALVLSMASLAGFLPQSILGMVAGTLVDRIDRKKAMIIADLFIAGVGLMLVIASFFGEVSMWFILLILAIRSVGTAFHTPAISAVTPLIVPIDQLTKCAGYTQSIQTMGYITGAAMAGILYPICSMSMMVMLDVGGAIIAAISVMLIDIPTIMSSQEDSHIIKEMKDGYYILKQHKGLFSLLWIAALFMILYSPINALFPLMSLDYFGKTTFHASLSEITFSIGMLIGGVILGYWGGFKKRSKGIAFSIALMGLPIALTGLLLRNGFWIFAILCMIMGLSVPFYNGPVTALMQEKIAPEYLGRVFGLYGSIASLAMPIGLVFSGTFADYLGINTWFFLTGVLCVTLAFVTYMLPSIKNIDE